MMLRRVVPVPVVAIAVLLLMHALLPTRAVPASIGAPRLQATPEAPAPTIGADLPEGVTLQLLASAAVPSFPAGPAVLTLERVSLSPGERFQSVGDAPRLIAIERGDLLAEVEGTVTHHGEGANVFLPAEAAATITAGGSGTVFLQFRVGAEAVGASPVASPMGTPSAESVPTVLIRGEVSRLPVRNATLFIARVTLAPGADTGRQVFPGPIGIAVESGELQAEGPDGGPVRLGAGGSLVVFALNAVRAENPGTEPATALLIGILPEPAAGATAPTPTPGPDFAATATVLTGEQERLAATIEAQETALAGARAALATAEAQGTAVQGETEATVVALQTALARSESEQATSLATVGAQVTQIAAQGTEIAEARGAADATAAAAETAIAGGDAARQTAEAELAAAQGTAQALSTAVAESEAQLGAAEAGAATAQATTEAQATALAERESALQAAEAANESARSTAEALATARAAVEATATAESAAMATREAEIRASAAAAEDAATTQVAQIQGTVTAQEAEIAAAATEQANLRATLAAQSTALTETRAAQATAEAQGAAVQEEAAAGAATIVALQTAQAETLANLAAVEATAGAAATEAAATIAAQSTAGAEAQVAAAATSAAYETAVALQGAEGTRVAGEAAATTQAHLAFEESLVATISAQATAAAQTAATATAEAATVANERQAATATIAALATQAAELGQRATVSLNPNYVQISVMANRELVVAGVDDAIEDLREELTDALQPYADAGCRAGVVLTFGHAQQVNQAVQLSAVTNAQLRDLYPAVFEGSAFENFIDVTPPDGQVDIRIYFFTGCAPAEQGGE